MSNSEKSNIPMFGFNNANKNYQSHTKILTAPPHPAHYWPMCARTILQGRHAFCKLIPPFTQTKDKNTLQSLVILTAINGSITTSCSRFFCSVGRHKIHAAPPDMKRTKSTQLCSQLSLGAIQLQPMVFSTKHGLETTMRVCVWIRPRPWLHLVLTRITHKWEVENLSEQQRSCGQPFEPTWSSSLPSCSQKEYRRGRSDPSHQKRKTPVDFRKHFNGKYEQVLFFWFVVLTDYSCPSLTVLCLEKLVGLSCFR